MSATHAEVEERLKGLVGRTLESIDVVAMGVAFNFGPKDGDNGVTYWVHGGPRPLLVGKHPKKAGGDTVALHD